MHGNYSNSNSLHGNGMSQHGNERMIDKMNQMMMSAGSPTKGGMHEMASREVSGHGFSSREVSGHGRA